MHFVHGERIGCVVAFVARLVEAVHHVGESALVRGGHLADAETDIRAIDVVVGIARFDKHRHADVVSIIQTADHGLQCRLFNVERGAPVGRVVHEDENVRAFGREGGIGQENVGVVVDRIEHRESGLRHGKQRGGGDGAKVPCMMSHGITPWVVSDAETG